MINLGELHFNIDVPCLSKQELEAYSSKLFDDLDDYLTANFSLSDYSILIEVEDGSIKGKTKLGALLTVLYFGVAQYGSFIGAVQTITKQVKGAGDYLTTQINSKYALDNVRVKTSNYRGQLGQIESLFNKVKSNKISVEVAMEKAEAILGEEVLSSPEFVRDLNTALKNIPKDGEQLNFDQEDFLTSNNEENKPDKPKPSRESRPAPDPILHNRVEIWRESKKGKKQIRVTQI